MKQLQDQPPPPPPPTPTPPPTTDCCRARPSIGRSRTHNHNHSHTRSMRALSAAPKQSVHRWMNAATNADHSSRLPTSLLSQVPGALRCVEGEGMLRGCTCCSTLPKQSSTMVQTVDLGSRPTRCQPLSRTMTSYPTKPSSPPVPRSSWLVARQHDTVAGVRAASARALGRVALVGGGGVNPIP